ncbi:MAG: LacI family transcriptional regulator [Oscillospiraceae bacterium]|jgi:LacI family transcriptional regulator|nr:LacI family transcriptional regulator [Oscillospiraceae bacterium]
MSIYDIAKLAGVSVSTVSKVINKRGVVAESTKNRVMSVMMEHDFRPKIGVNELTNIGLFSHVGNIFTSAFLNELLAGITEYFFERNYGVLLLPTDRIPRDRRAFRIFCHKERLAGGIFLDLATTEDYVKQIDGVVPLVTVNSRHQGEMLYSVLSDDYDGCTQAIEYLFRMGHRRIAFGTTGTNYLSHRMRLQAYRDVLRDHELEPDERLIFSVFRDFSAVYDGWLKAELAPTAIVTINDQEALRLISLLKARGLRIPSDISVVGFDNYSFVEQISPPLTTVRQPLYEVSRQAASIIYTYVTEGPKRLKPEYVLSQELIVRSSVADIRGSHMQLSGGKI